MQTLPKILVTGAAGYIGSVLCEELLKEGYRVTALDNLMYAPRSLFHLIHDNNFKLVLGDARDQNIIKPLIGEVDYIIPLAAIVGAPASDKNP